jgi:hypothetical protein
MESAARFLKELPEKKIIAKAAHGVAAEIPSVAAAARRDLPRA